MTATDQENVRRWMPAWRTAGPLLEQVRTGEIRATDMVKAMAMEEDAFSSAGWLNRPRAGSGSVEHEEIFSRAGKRIQHLEPATAAENQRSSAERGRPVRAGDTRKP